MRCYTIQPLDIGKSYLDGPQFEPLGIVQNCDVGKRCFRVVETVWQVENQAQFEERKKKE